jgi:molecular chaperone Hsp33
MSSKDAVIPFLFESLPVRGAFVQLDGAWQQMRDGHHYAAPVAEILGHAAAATTLIAQSLKFDGSITLQINSDGLLRMLVMQCTDKLDLRGMASSEDASDTARFAELVIGARCAVTVNAGAMARPYQGIVEFREESLAASLENYFAHSVQVPSLLKLVTGTNHCGGILLQQMPGEQAASDDWQRLACLIATLRTDELAPGASAELLQKLFAEDDLRVFEPRPLRFRCRCSQSRVEEVLRLLGEAEVREALAERGRVEVNCEFCGKQRSFDPVDVGRLFAGPAAQRSDALH